MRNLLIVFCILISIHSCKKSDDPLLLNGNYLGSWVMQENRWVITQESTGSQTKDTIVTSPLIKDAVLTINEDSTYEMSFTNGAKTGLQQYTFDSEGKITFDHNVVIVGNFRIRANSSFLELTSTSSVPGGFIRDNIFSLKRK